MDDFFQGLSEILKLTIGPVTGAALALIVNRLFEIRSKKPKLVFGVRCVEDPSDNDSNYSPSGYQLYCLNIGNVPVFIEEVSFYFKKYKKDNFLDVFPVIENELSPILPYSYATFDLNREEYDSIFYHCEERNVDQVKVIAHSVGGKCYNGEIDLWWIKSQFGINTDPQ